MIPWTWTVVLVLAVLLFGMVAIFRGAEDPELRKAVLGWLDRLVPFILGAGSGGGGGALIIATRSDMNLFGGAVPALTWPIAVTVSCLVISIVLMIRASEQGEIRDKLLGYANAVVPFAAGLLTGAGGAVALLG